MRGRLVSSKWLKEIKFDANGLVPAIVQDAKSGQVLMMAYMGRQAVLKTLKTGKTHFYSRSRKKSWLKGESSGHYQLVKQIALDCDGDTLLIKVTQKGGACHTGFYSCFFRHLHMSHSFKNLKTAWKIKGKKVFDPQAVYAKRR